MANKELSDALKDIISKRLSAQTRYDSFVNIVEEPELSLFPDSQFEVLKLLCKVNKSNSKNMLVMTTHSPYSLAILNTLIMAGKANENGNDEIKSSVKNTLKEDCAISPNDLIAYRLDPRDHQYCKRIVDVNTQMISKNSLDSASETIMRKFNTLYRLYAKTLKRQ